MLPGALGLPSKAAKSVYINPAVVNPASTYGMANGMVSTFLSPGRSVPLAAVVADWHSHAEEVKCGRQHVAISLSLSESLLLPIKGFLDLKRAYQAASYPGVPLIELQRCDKSLSHVIE
jgi:hypothetical protein